MIRDQPHHGSTAEETFRATLTGRTPTGADSTLIVTRQGVGSDGRVWLTFDGAIKTTTVLVWFWCSSLVTLRFLSVGGYSVLVVSTRQLIPEGLAEIPAGPELARVLADLELSRLSGYDCVQVLKAQFRQANHERARLLAAMVEVGLCRPALAGQELRRRPVPTEFSADEVRAALVLTRRAAEDQFWLAWDLMTRLPQVHAAMDAGVLDEPRARVLSEWTLELSPEQAQAVCTTLLPRAPRLTTGQLIEQIKKLAIAIDPEWAQRRYEQAVAERKVVGRRNPDGSANLSGYNLPVDRVAAASGHIDALAKAVKRAGDSRPIDHIRADLFLGMTDGTYTGLNDGAIIELLTTTAPDTDHGDDTDGEPGGDDSDGEPGGADPEGPHDSGSDDSGYDAERPDAERPDAEGPDVQGPDSGGSGDGGLDRDGPGEAEPDDGEPEPDEGQQAEPCAPPVPGAAPRPLAWTGVELRVRLSTLLGRDHYPAEVAGWGPIHAELAREMATTLSAATWRYAITNEHGHLTHCGITRTRPTGTPTRTAGCRALVELQIPATELRALATNPTAAGNWARVITDLTCQLDHHPPDHHDCGDPTRRVPGARLRRYLQIRDRSCTMIGCRAPAHSTDQDHTIAHALGGPTTGPNLGGPCRHDHRLKGEGGWTLHQPKPGVFCWTSPTGHTYWRHPPPIIEPLPDPIPHDHPPDPLTIPDEDNWKDTQILAEPPPELDPDPPPEPDPHIEPDDPPF